MRVKVSQFPLYLQRLSQCALIIGSLFIHEPLCAQEVIFENFSTKNGLPSNEVYHMYQDKNGLIWFATDHGVCNYNGYTFKNLGLNDGLTSTTVFRFYPQKNGDVWCSTLNNRFCYFNPKDYIFHPYAYNDLLSKISSDAINDDLYIDSLGTLHVSYIDRTGYAAIDAHGKLLRSPLAKNDSAQYVTIQTTAHKGMFSYLDKFLGLPSPKDIYQFSCKELKTGYRKVAQHGEIQLISDLSTVYYLNKGKVQSIIRTNNLPIGLGFIDDSHFWVGYRYGGVVVYDLEGKPVQSYLNGKSVSRVLIDHEKGIWISTISDGVFYVRNLTIQHFFIEPQPHIYKLSVDRKGQLVASFYNGRLYTKTKNGFELLMHSEERNPTPYEYYNSIQGAVYYLPEANYPFTVESKKMHYQHKLGIYINNLSDERTLKPLLSGNSCFLVLYSPNHLVKYNVRGRVRDACSTKNGAFLAMNDGLYHFDTVMKKQWKMPSKLLNCRINDVDCFRKIQTIAATSGNGLVFINGNHTWAITKKDGLTSDLVSEVYIQNDSTLWVCTNEGLNRIVLGKNRTFTLLSITKLEGLIDNDITDIEIINDTAWIASRSGLSAFPLSLLTKKKSTPNYFLRIISTKVNGIKIQKLTDLSHWQNRIEINFQGISFKESGTLQYRYQLQGLDKTWYYTSNREITYEALPPGTYTFVLQAGANGNWSDELITAPIVISPPFYKTAWFIVLSICSIVVLIYLFFKYRILSYNRDITREMLRQLLKRIKPKSDYFIVKNKDTEMKISSGDVLYVKSLGNYLEIHTEKGKYVIRDKISNFLQLVPDPIEYIQIRRSYIVRLDKITHKSATTIGVNGEELKVGETYRKVLSQIHL